MNYALKRFIKAFLSGGLASAVVLLGTPPGEDMNKWILGLAFAFITGGIMAIEKLLQTHE